MCFMFSYFHNRSDGRHSSHRSLRSPYEDITDPIVCGLCTLYQSSLQIFSFFIYFFLVSPFNFSERPIRLFQLLEEKEVIIANAIQQFIIYISINIYLIFIELLHQWIQFSSSFGSLSLTLFCVNLQSFERFQQNRSEFCIIRKIFFSSHIAVYSSPLYWKNPSILIFLFLFFFLYYRKKKNLFLLWSSSSPSPFLLFSEKYIQNSKRNYIVRCTRNK
jgi:hypothetical protein